MLIREKALCFGFVLKSEKMIVFCYLVARGCKRHDSLNDRRQIIVMQESFLPEEPFPIFFGQGDSFVIFFFENVFLPLNGYAGFKIGRNFVKSCKDFCAVFCAEIAWQTTSLLWKISPRFPLARKSK